MPFDPVTMTLRVTSAGSSVAPVDVKRSGPAPFRLRAGSIPTTPLPGAPLPTNPAQPFSCPDSTTDFATGGQKSPLSFANSQAMSQDWRNAFIAKRTLLLQMEIPGQQGEKLTVKLQYVDETQVSLRSARVVAPSGEGEGEGEGEGVDGAVSGCSISNAPRNAAGLGALTLLGLMLLRRRRQTLRAR